MFKKKVIAGILTATMIVGANASFAFADTQALPKTAITQTQDFIDPYAKQTQAKFQSMTEQSPLSVITVKDRKFKKYQNLAYLLKYGWFTSGLTGLELAYGVDDSGSPIFWFTNKNDPLKTKDDGYTMDITQVQISATDMTTGNNVFIYQVPDGWDLYGTPQYDTVAFDEDDVMDVVGMDDPFKDINDDIYVDYITYSYYANFGGHPMLFTCTYDFDYETLSLQVQDLLTGSESHDQIKLTYDVLKTHNLK